MRAGGEKANPDRSPVMPRWTNALGHDRMNQRMRVTPSDLATDQRSTELRAVLIASGLIVMVATGRCDTSARSTGWCS